MVRGRTLQAGAYRGRVGGRPLLAFPGNPVSAQVSFVVFLREILRAAAGLPPVNRVRAVLDDAVVSPAGRRQLLRGRWVRPAGPGASAGTTPHVAVVGGPGSHLVASMAAADVLIDVPAAATTLEPGAEVAVWPL